MYMIYEAPQANIQTKKVIISLDDLMVCEDDSQLFPLYLTLRFKNCTGNRIDFTQRDIVVNDEDLAFTQLALSIDPNFKNIRNRTIRQCLDMVIRWRIIGMGYYDFQIHRYVHPMTFYEAALNLDMRHKMLSGKD